MKGLCLYRSIPDSDVDPQMIVSAPSQLCSQTRCFGQISIEYPVFHGDMCIAVEYSPNMIRGTGDRAVSLDLASDPCVCGRATLQRRHLFRPVCLYFSLTVRPDGPRVQTHGIVLVSDIIILCFSAVNHAANTGFLNY